MVGRSWNHKDLTGKRFGRLTVLRFEGKKLGHLMWECKCDCGEMRIVRGSALTSMNTQSCGCFHREKSESSGRAMGLLYGGWNWKGGINQYPKDWEKIRKVIYQRDGFSCVICGKTTFINAHHLDGNTKNCDENNLITVCKGCHKKLHIGQITFIREKGLCNQNLTN